MSMRTKMTVFAAVLVAAACVYFVARPPQAESPPMAAVEPPATDLEPVDAAAVDPATEQGLFLWKDASGEWHLRVTGGTSGVQFKGEIVSDMALVSLRGNSLEPPDVVDYSVPGRVRFELGVAPGFEDELIIGFAPGADIDLNLDNPAKSGLVMVGAEKWPIANLPVDLSGW